MTTYDVKQIAKSELEQAVRNFMKASEADGDLEDETIDAIADTIFDASDKKIKFQETY